MEIGFLIAISFCVVILLIILRWSTIHWIIKCVLTIAAIPVVFMFYFGLISSMGWPADVMPTCLLRVEGVDIREPMGDYNGDIYVWYLDEDEYVKTHKRPLPRSIHIPYTKADHSKFSLANEIINNGRQPLMRLKRPEGSSKLLSMSGGDGDGQGSADFVAPPNTLPVKHGADGQIEN